MPKSRKRSERICFAISREGKKRGLDGCRSSGSDVRPKGSKGWAIGTPGAPQKTDPPPPLFETKGMLATEK